MTRNLRIFVGVAALITLGYILAGQLINHLPDGLQGFANLLYLIAFFWIAFDLIVKIIYRLAGVPMQKDAKDKKLTHQQAETVGRFWMAWLITAVATGLTYVLLFDRQSLKSSLVTAGVFAVLILLSFVSNRQKIMGHTKKELFQ